MNIVTAPFKHAILNDYWPDDLLEAVRSEVPPPFNPAWHLFSNENERKMGGKRTMWGTKTWTLFDDHLDAPDFLGELADAFGIGAPVTVDDYGGGYHLIPPGGFLASHVDFNRHPKTQLWRRLNLIIFLNHGWDEAYGGELVLGADADVVIEPRWNTTVIFETNDQSWHGHPVPTAAGFWRYSFAAYFYSEEPPPNVNGEHSTVFLEVAS